ncbi:MAG: hypothetical protein ACD_37C00210G0002 [uncultured bacterium]|nr:MAG: hypothetical protein ACD_37C00210G0002 [uncultured bacterium]
MEFALRSIKIGFFFTSRVVYSILANLSLQLDLFLALKARKLSLNLSNSYTHSDYQFEKESAIL